MASRTSQPTGGKFAKDGWRVWWLTGGVFAKDDHCKLSFFLLTRLFSRRNPCTNRLVIGPSSAQWSESSLRDAYTNPTLIKVDVVWSFGLFETIH
jgi:hypothetical protein